MSENNKIATKVFDIFIILYTAVPIIKILSDK